MYIRFTSIVYNKDVIYVWEISCNVFFTEDGRFRCSLVIMYFSENIQDVGAPIANPSVCMNVLPKNWK